MGHICAREQPSDLLLAGAGFSKLTSNLPVISQLFDFAVSTDRKYEAKRLKWISDHFEFWRSLYPEKNIEEFIGEYGGSTSNRQIVNWYVARRLVEPFIARTSSKRYSWYINSHFAKSDPGVARARHLIYSFIRNGGRGIITTNYDLIIEYALGTNGFNYGLKGEQIGFSPYPISRPVYVRGDLPLAKLHGSLSWNSDGKHPDCRHALKGDCLITPPVWEKEADRELEPQWALARKLIGRSSSLCVFGFCFNDNDLAIRELFYENRNRFKYVRIFDIIDHRDRFSYIFPDSQIDFIDTSINGPTSSEVSFVLKQQELQFQL